MLCQALSLQRKLNFKNKSRISWLAKLPVLSLGRVVPAPHTRHLLGLFAAIAQNSLLRSFSIVDSFASRQHSCRGSEELAIRKTARFQATPNYSELLRVGAQELRATPSYSEWAPKNSELFRATPSHSELLRATRALRARIDFAGLRSYSELLRARGAQELRATQSQSELLRALRASWSCKLGKGCPKQRVDSHRRLELLLRACRLQNCKLF